MKKGKFIVVEGMEGCGKTTNMAFIATFLEQAGVQVSLSREPGGTPLAEEIRQILLSNRDEKFNEQAELLLVFGARAQHLHEKIEPLLNEGRWVLCDRFTDATYAYQGGGRQLSLDMITTLEQLVQGSFRPDLVIVLDVPPEKGLARASSRGALDRFEREKTDFFIRVREMYLQRAAKEPYRYCVVNADQPLEVVQNQLASELTKFLESASL